MMWGCADLDAAAAVVGSRSCDTVLIVGAYSVSHLVEYAYACLVVDAGVEHLPLASCDADNSHHAC